MGGQSRHCGVCSSIPSLLPQEANTHPPLAPAVTTEMSPDSTSIPVTRQGLKNHLGRDPLGWTPQVSITNIRFPGRESGWASLGSCVQLDPINSSRGHRVRGGNMATTSPHPRGWWPGPGKEAWTDPLVGVCDISFTLEVRRSSLTLQTLFMCGLGGHFLRERPVVSTYL